jgi:hypothetical protein
VSVIGDLFGAGGVSSLLSNVIDKIFPDPAKAAEAKAQLLAAENAPIIEQANQEFQTNLEQIKTNAVEAASQSVFVAGWRPFVGWICGFALGYAAVFEPLMEFIAKTAFHYAGDFPKLDTTVTMQALFGILGLGAYRSVEKVRGVAGAKVK